MSMWHKIFEICRQEIDQKWKNYREAAGEKEIFLIAIDGMCGSGKTTLGEHLQDVYGCRLFHMDDFFLQPHQRTAERLAQPGGNVDYERFRTEVLEHLGDKEGLWLRRFDCGSFTLEPAVKVPYHEMVIVEGAYSCHPYFGEIYDMKFFLESSREGQQERILFRSGPEKLARFQEVWIPMEERYFETHQIRKKCRVLRVD